MERSSQHEEEEEEKEESGDELQKQLKHLVEDYSVKQSNPRGVQVQQCLPTPTLTPMPMSSGVWKVRNNDLVVEEIIRERRAAIESGKLKGRRLFDFDLDTLDGSTGDFDINIRWGEDRSSGHSSVLIQGSEVRSICSSDDNDDDEDDDEDHGFGHDTSFGGYSQLSSSPPVSALNVGKKRHIWRGGGGGGGGERRRVLMMMGYLAIFVILSVLGIISLKSFEGFGDQQSFDSLIPT